MGFVVNTTEGKAGDRTGTVYELTDTAGTVRAEVWPMWGFNCLRWQVRQPDGSWAGVLFTMPDWEANPVPTRSGHPILFPFPGRLREGKLAFGGQTYQLPLTDSTKQHSIHGFTPRNPWRVVESGGGADSASVTGQFSLGKDLPASVGHWPADFNLNVTYRLSADALRVEATVENLGTGPLPFGLGYHPYFRLPGVTDPDVGGHVLQANVGQVWAVDANNLPTGERKELPPALDFRRPRPIGSTSLDNVLTAVCGPTGSDGLTELAVLSHPASPRRLRFLADGSFRELVLFIPAHRQAVAVEPYTCSADAGNFAARGIDSGWRTVPDSGRWTGVVDYRLDGA